MKKILLMILIFSIFMGCTSLRPFTDISFVEIVNENTRIYHVRYPDYITLNIEVGPAVYLIEGVQSVLVIPYACTVTKSPVYTWDEVEGEIKILLIEFEAKIEEKEPEKDILI